MNSVAQPQQPGIDRPERRIRKQRKTLRRIGLVAAGVAIAIVVTGRAFAAPLPAHTAGPGCMTDSGAQPNGKQWPAEPAMAIDQGFPYSATLQTNCGAITLSLDAARAPRTVNSFAFLAGEQYFDHTRCHRLTTESIFVLQCGDPTGTGTGTPGYRFDDENLTGATYPAGTVAMANSGPNTNGSQFFLVYADSPLPPKYTPFGRITAGMDVLQNIAGGGARDGAPDGPPATDVSLESVTAGQG
ncbi:peptidylprolyl isomerase [Nocardia mexicana]|uniref:Peptidyl-prolyl cis-trans isomerase n=1 Tax=Nocardia mexicana TaxID=279262 RepID=A0A370H5V4_9NOCA|nr:peptidylprolyl isomerase [Nocardia mexicana]RDI50872.1 peptidyl-prolyl cis-trans isomerase B (cyclophilin B) [Nocardia mexicana]